MKWLFVISTLILFSCFENKSSKANQTIQGTDTTSKNNLPKIKYDYIIFGRFCGECASNCAIMYKLNLADSSLLVDSTDSYWQHKWDSPMKFESRVKDRNKIKSSFDIADSIPPFIFSRSRKAFGCPDCTDGCGMFLETKKDTVVTKFYIDYQLYQISDSIMPFAEFLKRKIDEFDK